MQVSAIKKDAVKTGERVVDQFATSKEAVMDAWDDAKHFVERSGRNLRELVGDAKYNIKHYPIRSVAVAFGAGILLGAVISRNGRR